ncbi:hypothetical protein TREES_T100000348 [Tupaia chinensis]|uniref:Uncharacterized protein n=1 Tax=Tupaia chinensis TaxID=246437 RepID=L9L2H0_TUPCH|nr:hypothetical protein TREES_T100000348 [Tupaia chinensis]
MLEALGNLVNYTDPQAYSRYKNYSIASSKLYKYSQLLQGIWDTISWLLVMMKRYPEELTFRVMVWENLERKLSSEPFMRHLV